MLQVNPPSPPLESGPPTQSKPRRRTRQPSKASRAIFRAPKSFEFISSDSAGKPPADTRKFIRSHVMRGKNTKKRSVVYQTSEPSRQTDEDGRNDGSIPSPSSSRTSVVDATATSCHHLNSRVVGPGNHRKWAFMVFPWGVPAPVKTPHDLALVKFPEAPDSHTQQLIHRFFTAIKETMYPVEWCFSPDSTQSCWFQWLFVDLAYYYSCLFVVSSLQDLYRAIQQPALVSPSSDESKKFSQQTARYLWRTIELLQKRLENPESQLEDVTVATVVSLAMAADAAGDVEGTKAHVNGLKRMVRMRGGIKGMMSNRHVLTKICRVDLGYSIKFGERPEFVADDLSWEPSLDKLIQTESPISPPTATTGLHSLAEGLDPKLRNVFHDLRAFSSVADGLVASKSKLRPELFQELMISIQYRLLLLEYALDTQPIAEAIRCGLLAFQTSVFLQMHGTKFKYDFISEQLAKAIQRLPETSPVLVQLKTWLAFIGSIAVLDSNEPWLVATIRRLTLSLSWAETRRSLQDVMWIGVIHDTAGKQVYDGARDIRDTVRMGLQRFWTEFPGTE